MFHLLSGLGVHLDSIETWNDYNYHPDGFEEPESFIHVAPKNDTSKYRIRGYLLSCLFGGCRVR